MQKHKSFKKLSSIVAAFAILGAVILPFATPASAASLSNTYIRLDRIAASTATSVRVVFKTSAVNGTEAKVVVDFDTGSSFTVNTTQTITTAACASETGFTALPTGTTLAATGDNSAKSVTVTAVSDLAVSTTYCFDLTSTTAVTTPTAGIYTGNVATQTAGSAAIDNIDVAERIIANDQIVVNASVPPSFTFALSGNTDTIPAINSGTISSSTGRTVTITTNASKGWIAWVRSLNGGLTSASASKTILTTQVGSAAHTLSASAEDYALDVDLTTDAAGGGTVTIDSFYNGASTSAGGGIDNTKLRPIASSNGTAGGSGDVLTLIERASAAVDTPAANDYTDTLTVIGAGSY